MNTQEVNLPRNPHLSDFQIEEHLGGEHYQVLEELIALHAGDVASLIKDVAMLAGITYCTATQLESMDRTYEIYCELGQARDYPEPILTIFGLDMLWRTMVSYRLPPNQ